MTSPRDFFLGIEVRQGWACKGVLPDQLRRTLKRLPEKYSKFLKINEKFTSIRKSILIFDNFHGNVAIFKVFIKFIRVYPRKPGRIYKIIETCISMPVRVGWAEPARSFINTVEKSTETSNFSICLLMRDFVKATFSKDYGALDGLLKIINNSKRNLENYWQIFARLG